MISALWSLSELLPKHLSKDVVHVEVCAATKIGKLWSRIVILGTLCRITEHSISLLDFLELDRVH